MNFAQLTNEIRQVVRDDSPEIVSRIPDWINETVEYLIDAASIPGFKRLIPVQTALGQSYVQLPSEASERITYVGDANGELPVRSLEEMVRLYPTMNEEGSLECVAIEGRLLYYQKIPSTATTIYLLARAAVTPMTGPNDEPEGVPPHLHMRTIVPRVAFLAYSKIEEGLEEGEKVNTRHWNREFQRGFAELLGWVSKRKRHLSVSCWRY